MKRAAAILALAMLAAGCAGEAGDGTSTLPALALDPDAPAGNASSADGSYLDDIFEGETWVWHYWVVTAGGPIDVTYLNGESCAGWASRAPLVEYSLPASGGHWVFSFSPDIPAMSGSSGTQDIPEGLVLIVQGPDGDWVCSGEYQVWQNFPGPALELPSALTGVYDIWVAAAEEGTSVDGFLAILAPETSYPTTTTTEGPTEASTVPGTGG